MTMLKLINLQISSSHFNFFYLRNLTKLLIIIFIFLEIPILLSLILFFHLDQYLLLQSHHIPHQLFLICFFHF